MLPRQQLLHQLVQAPEKQIPETIAETFLAVDEELTRLSDNGTTNSGCTAVTAFLRLEDEKGNQSFAPPIGSLVTLSPLSTTSSKSGRSSEENSRSSTPTSAASKRDKVRSIIASGFSGGASKKNAEAADQARSQGPTAAIAVEGKPRRVLYTANVGDARAVLARQGKGVRLTYDHKGSDKKEVRRIQEAGGFVLNNRVNGECECIGRSTPQPRLMTMSFGSGVLAVTRSLGDSAMKDYVVGSPYTSEMELTEKDEYLIIACDGVGVLQTVYATQKLIFMHVT